MDHISKIIGLSRKAFSILASAYGIDKIIYFEGEEGCIPAEQQKEEYLKTLFQMNREEIVCLKDGMLEPAEEIREFFRIMKESSKVMTAEKMSTDSIDMCLYIMRDGNMLVLREGNRKNEYVKLEKRTIKDLYQLLADGGHLPRSTINESFVEVEAEPEMEDDESIQVLQALEKKQFHQLKKIPQTETLIKVHNAKTGMDEAALVILHRPLRDKIFLIRGEKTETYIYSDTVVMTCLENMLEEDEDDIS